MKTTTVVTALLLGCSLASAQSRTNDLVPILERSLQSPELVTYQLRQSLYRSIPQLPSPTSSAAWTAEAERIRRHLLNDVVFHGWPREWVDSAPKFEEVGVIETGHGYRMRKLRYEVVPGFYSTAILYEPEHITGKIPAVLNVNGHDYALGKASEYKQKRCINLARRGMLALSLEWLSCGELNTEENHHTYLGHLDLDGVNGVGLFYLEMRRGLDYLDQHPNTDRSRLAVTGLSGGGWQTIVLSTLDPRVLVSIPVAGFSAMVSKLERRNDLGDNEQTPADFFVGQEYSTLVAMRAPRPTLLIHNAEDDCCFRAPLVKPYTYDRIRPFFRLYGKEDSLAWHENRDPATHNYQLDNRLAAYKFLSQHFGLPAITDELDADSDVKSMEELRVGLPPDNLTILGLARKIAAGIHRESGSPEAARTRLKSVVRYEPVQVEHAFSVANTKNRGVETMSFQILFNNQLTATAVSAEAIGNRRHPVTLVLDDRGKRAAAAEISDRVNRGERTLAVDLVFHADASTAPREMHLYVLLYSAIGKRALGMEAAQLLAIARWARERAGGAPIRVETFGRRYQVAALTAAALEPGLFSEVAVHDGMNSLQELLDKPVKFEDAADIFCPDLYKEFDLAEIATLGSPKR